LKYGVLSPTRRWYALKRVMVLVENVVTTTFLKNVHTLKFYTVILIFEIVFQSFNFPQAEIMIIRLFELE